MLRKRGQGLTTGTLLLIVLGIIVLVFLVYGFSVGWGNMFDRIINFGGGNSNAATLASACQVACQAQDSYGYNQQRRELKLDNKVKLDVTCEMLESARTFTEEGCYMFSGIVASLISGVVEDDCKALWDGECKVNGNSQIDVLQADCEAFWVPAGSGWNSPIVPEKCSI